MDTTPGFDLSDATRNLMDSTRPTDGVGSLGMFKDIHRASKGIPECRKTTPQYDPRYRPWKRYRRLLGGAYGNGKNHSAVSESVREYIEEDLRKYGATKHANREMHPVVRKLTRQLEV